MISTFFPPHFSNLENPLQICSMFCFFHDSRSYQDKNQCSLSLLMILLYTYFQHCWGYSDERHPSLKRFYTISNIGRLPPWDFPITKSTWDSSFWVARPTIHSRDQVPLRLIFGSSTPVQLLICYVTGELHGNPLICLWHYWWYPGWVVTYRSRVTLMSSSP